MKTPKKSLSLFILSAIAALAGCQTDHLYLGRDVYREGVVIRGGKRLEPGLLALNDHYAFTFLDRWRVNLSWLSGPLDIFPCHFTHPDNNGFAIDRFIEAEGRLVTERVATVGDRVGTKFISNSGRFIYGLNSKSGKYDGYSAFCSHAFVDIWTGVSVLLIKPDPANGTDAWIAGAERVSVNGLTWLKQSAPVKDNEEVRQQRSALVERWVLEIPQSPYWLVILLGGSRSSDGKGPGIDRDPEKFSKVRDLVHGMVQSVRLEPIDAPPSSLPPPPPQNPTGRGSSPQG